MIVVDTSIVLAFMNRADAAHGPAREWMATVEDDLVTTPLAIAEMDHLVTRHGGPAAAEALYADLAAGAYQVEWWRDAMRETIEVARTHAPTGLGLTDASLVALAARLRTTLVATLDARHFRTVRPLTGEPAFTLLPGPGS